MHKEIGKPNEAENVRTARVEMPKKHGWPATNILYHTRIKLSFDIPFDIRLDIQQDIQKAFWLSFSISK
jgi:hypothetical protein